MDPAGGLTLPPSVRVLNRITIFALASAVFAQSPVPAARLRAVAQFKRQRSRGDAGLQAFEIDFEPFGAAGASQTEEPAL
jgi:hypothetical protein